MNLSELIDVLTRVCAAYGDGAVRISDADTSLEMPIYRIERTADGTYLLNGEGYTDSPDVRYSRKPLLEVWGAGAVELPPAPDEFIEYSTLVGDDGLPRRVVLLSAGLYERMVAQWSADRAR